MKKNYLIIAIIIIAPGLIIAQNEDDILRYSKTGLMGSARVLGAGGAWGAVGADFSSIAINPAGLGLYRKNEFMGSMAITSNSSGTSYIGTSTNGNRTNFNI